MLHWDSKRVTRKKRQLSKKRHYLSVDETEGIGWLVCFSTLGWRRRTIFGNAITTRNEVFNEGTFDVIVRTR